MFDCMFFARQDELRAIVTELQHDAPLYAIQTGLHELRDRPILPLSRIRPLDVCPTLEELKKPYLVHAAAAFVVDEIPQRRGGLMYDVNIKSNPDAWYLVVGGEAQPNALVPGRIAGSLERNGMLLRASFQRATRLYSKEGPFLVSPSARRLALGAGRLVANGNPDSPLEFDLSIPAERNTEMD
jgi:hypothetical protein